MHAEHYAATLLGGGLEWQHLRIDGPPFGRALLPTEPNTEPEPVTLLSLSPNLSHVSGKAAVQAWIDSHTPKATKTEGVVEDAGRGKRAVKRRLVQVQRA